MISSPISACLGTDGCIAQVTRGLDPRVHPFARGRIAGSSPAITPSRIDLTEIDSRVNTIDGVEAHHGGAEIWSH